MQSRGSADIAYDLWPSCGRIFTGMFFLTSAYMKLTNGFFMARTAPLATDWQYWLDRKFTLGWYRPILEWFMPYADQVAIIVILMHGIAGVLLLLNARVRTAGFILLLMQLNIWFATMKGWGFLVMVGASIWLALYYLSGPPCGKRAWRWLTLAFIALDILMVYGRYVRGDPWTSAFASHLANYKVEAMGSLPALKPLVLSFSSTAFAPWVWASMWWIHLVILALLFTRYRLQAGVVLLVLFMGRSLLWLNVLGAEATVYVLFAFVWLAEEFRQQRTSPPVRLLDIFGDMKSFFSRFTR
jgi:uncharacterized membrane protein YphA (DoxX/SURF4 family)